MSYHSGLENQVSDWLLLFDDLKKRTVVFLSGPDIFWIQGFVAIPKSSAVIPQPSAVIAQSTKIRSYSIRAAQNIQNFKNRPNNHKVMSITVHLKKHHFFLQELAKILDFRVTVRSDNDIYRFRFSALKNVVFTGLLQLW